MIKKTKNIVVDICSWFESFFWVNKGDLVWWCSFLSIIYFIYG